MTYEEEVTLVATRWLIYQHGMSDQEATETLSSVCAARSRMDHLKQEAFDVAYFVVDGAAAGKAE